MKAITEGNWAGWNPSSAEKNLQPDGGLTGPVRRQLLRMDNLTIDEVGILRAALSYKVEAKPGAPHSLPGFDTILNLYSCILSGIGKVRYIYEGSGAITRNSGPATILDTTILTGGTGRSAFLAILNHVFVIAGSKKYQDRGDIVYPLGIPAPAMPVVTPNATYTVDLSNLSGGFYTNWGAVNWSTFNNSGTTLVIGTDNSSINVNRAVFGTTYASLIDTTNLGGANNDTGADQFSFTFLIDNADVLTYVKLELFCETPPLAQNYFWKEWDFPNGNNYLTPFNVTSGVPTKVQLSRLGLDLNGNINPADGFIRVGTDATLGWKTIKAVRFTVGVTALATVTFSDFKVSGGKLSTLTGGFNYIAVQVRDTGSYLEFSPSSFPSYNVAFNGNFTITPVAVDAVSGCNQYWLFRRDVDATGLYLRVNSQTGVVGFTPAPFVDSRLAIDLLTDAGINPLYNLQFYRTVLPNNIISMIWFRDRMIYLTPSNFFPSFLLDPGSYDARFTYEISGTGGNSETCLFICKVDVGTFIVATTKDFYRVTGTFSIIQDPVTGAVIQDVNIYSLGVADPSISRVFTEYQGSIIYLSATGIRSLNNATSVLLIGNLELLFRNEDRYGVKTIQQFSNDSLPVACASSGHRIYWSLPQTDGFNRVFILNISVDGSYSWRLWTIDPAHNPTALYREEDGTVIFGSNAAADNWVNSIETLAGSMPIHFRTQFNYGDNPLARKDAVTFKILINTGNNVATITITGLTITGALETKVVTLTNNADLDYEIDLSPALDPCVAFAVDITCTTSNFNIQYFSLSYEEHPIAVRHAKFLASNFDTGGRKRVGSWPFRVNLLGPGTLLTATANADGVDQPADTFTGYGDVIKTLFWNGDPTVDVLARDWELNLTADSQFELFEIQKPDIIEVTPSPSGLVIAPYTNFGTSARKTLGPIAFKLNPTGLDFTLTLKVDGVTQTPRTFTGNPSRIVTMQYDPPIGLTGVDWERRLVCTSGLGIEFYEWIEPPIIRKFPVKTTYAIQPFTNFGIPNFKKISVWPMVIETFGVPTSVRVTVDDVILAGVNLTDVGQGTLAWVNTQDIVGMDWQIEVYSINEFEFYNFMKPDIEQVFPIIRSIHQVGPLDFNARGIVFGARFRLISATSPVHYKVYDSDVLAFEADLTVANADTVYEEKFPKGIDSSVCKIVITGTAFYHFSTEFKVRTTGKDTEEKYIMVKDSTSG